MNCTRIEELLPLYVGADLAAPEAEPVRAHLAVCANCRASAQAFADSQAWYQAAPLPEFDEDFLACIRTAVHEEIVKLNAQPSLWERLKFGLAWRPLAAISCLLLVLLGWMLYQRISRTPGSTPQHIASNERTQPQPVQPTPAPALGLTTPAGNEKRTASPKSNRQQRRSNELGQESAPIQKIDLTQQDIAANLTGAPPTEPQAAVPTEVAAPVEMMRMEIQTADPNIRIIWLTPKMAGTATNPTEPLTR